MVNLSCRSWLSAVPVPVPRHWIPRLRDDAIRGDETSQRARVISCVVIHQAKAVHALTSEAKVCARGAPLPVGLPSPEG